MNRCERLLTIERRWPLISAVSLIAVWLGCSIPRELLGGPNATIKVSMAISRQSRDECVVKITLVNTTTRSLRFDEDDLPWHVVGEKMTMALVLQDHHLKPCIERTAIISDPAVSLPVTLRGGEERSREVHLEAYYNKLPSALLRHDVTLLWLYRPSTKPPQMLEPVVGHLLIPRLE